MVAAPDADPLNEEQRGGGGGEKRFQSRTKRNHTAWGTDGTLRVMPPQGRQEKGLLCPFFPPIPDLLSGPREINDDHLISGDHTH